MLARLAVALPLLGLGALAAQDDFARRLRDLPEHPRLFLSDVDLAALRERHAVDATLKRFVRDAVAEAEQCLDAAELQRVLRGPRLLHVSRECLRRVQALALAWRWTGEQRYAARAVRDLRSVAAFADWNPSHFLDVAEMTHAAALGYDWLQPFLEDDDRRTIRAAIVAKGLLPGRAVYEQDGWWVRSAFNWNQVCNAGLITGALAVGDEETELASHIVARAVRSLPAALASYDPGGAWMEGPAYWDYATRYTAYGLDALRTALGTDFGLAGRDGLAAAAWFPIHAAGPSGLFFNFADAGEKARRGPSPCMLWLARTFGEPGFAAAEHEVLDGSAASPMHVVWYVPPPAAQPVLERARLFRGKVPVALFRSSWSDPGASFVAAKGGYNQVNHGHLDLGSFVFDALGVRWAEDLGSDDYNLPGYWNGRRGGQRWSYYRLASHSHNVVLVGGEDQDPMAVAEVAGFSAERQHVVFDLGKAYPKAAGAKRGVALCDRALLVQDELELKDARTVTWGLTTRAEIALSDGGPAVLRQGGKELVVRALAPAGAQWFAASAEQAPPQRKNAGVRRLELKVAGEARLVRIAVQLAPRGDGGAAAAIEVRPLADW